MSIATKTNTDELRNVLTRINTLPTLDEKFPELEYPGSAQDLLEGVQLIDQYGKLVNGEMPKRTSDDISVTDATITVIPGYYADEVSKSVATATQATPTISFADTTGIITASVTQPTGYVIGGTETTEYTLDVKNNSDLTTNEATVTIPKGYYPSQMTKSVTTTTQSTPIISIGSGSNAGIITASSTQSAGYVTAGTKTATYSDSNLKAENIKEGVSIFNVTGTFKGGMSANFKIIKYNSESELLAATPANNTIGVVTTVDISSWVFSPSAPTSPSSGMLWIETGKNGPIELNTLTENGIIVYPLFAKQYINETWIEIPAYNRQDDNWVSWIHDLIYYNNGQTDLSSTLTYKNVTVNANGYLNFSLGKNSNAYANTPVINLSGFNYVEVYYSNLSGNGDTFAGGMYIRILAIDGTTVIKTTSRNTSTSKTLILDISDLEGEYIVQVYSSNSSGTYTGSARVKTLKVLIEASAASVVEAKAAAYDIITGGTTT